MPRTLGAATAALLALAVAAQPVAAHGGGGTDYETKIRSLRPAGAGVHVRVLDRDDRLELRNDSGRTVVIEGYDGEPYVRMRADGTVEVNVRSPALYLNEDRFGDVTVPARADGKATPRWRLVDGSGRFEWHDHRIHWMGAQRPGRVRDPDRRTKVFDWTVPVRVGGEQGAVAGSLFWVERKEESFPLGAGLVLFAIAIGGLGLVLFIGRRRRRRSDRGEPADREEAW